MLTELPTTAELFSKDRALTTPARLRLMSGSNPKREKPSVSTTRLMLVEILFNHLRVFAAVVIFASISVLSLIVARSIMPFSNTTNEPPHSGHGAPTFRGLDYESAETEIDTKKPLCNGEPVGSSLYDENPG
jgi:hypothetical protein